jgi:hypothetical protein
MPPNTVKVDRTTKWGNPCVVGTHGTRAQCVLWFELALSGVVVIHRNPDGTWLTDQLLAYRKMASRDRRHLRGKNLACWCPLDQPCHADVLLRLANSPPPALPSRQCEPSTSGAGASPIQTPAGATPPATA